MKLHNPKQRNRRSAALAWALLSALAVAGLLTMGCSPVATPAPSAGATASIAAPTEAKVGAAPSATPKSGEQPRYGGVLATESANEPPHWDIHQVRNPYTVWFAGMAYNSLVEYDPLEPTKIIGDLAERWEISPDGKTYTFHLSKGVAWHDGKNFTSEDARYSIIRMGKPPEGTPSGWKDAFRGLESVDAPDSETVRIVMEYPRASLLPYLASAIYMMPKHIIEAKGDMKRDIVGTGPFRLKTYLAGSSITMQRNPSYFKKGRPYLDSFVRYVLKDAGTRFAALRTGQVLLTGPYSSALPPTQMEIARKDLADKLVVGELLQPNDLRVNLNLTKPPFSDLRVRQALNLAMDRKQMIAGVGQGYGIVGGVLPPGTPWAIAQSEIEKVPGFREPKSADVAEAKKLLSEAGYANGFKTGLLVRTASQHQSFAEVLKDQMRAIGIDMALEVVDAATFDNRLRMLGYEAAVRGGGLVISDPDDSLSVYLSTNRDLSPTGFADKEVDDLYDTQSKSLVTAERTKAVRELEKRILTLAPVAIGYWPQTFYAVSKKVWNYKPGMGTYSNPKYEVVWLSP